MEIEELDFNNPITISRFYCFYRDVFRKCFPKDEIGEFEDYIHLKQNENDEYTYHLDFVESDCGKYAACFIYCIFPKLKMMAGEFVCVDTPYRRRGLASALMRNAVTKHSCRWLFGEVEHDNAFNVLTWSRYGFKRIPVGYVQLPLGDGKKPVKNLMLCVLPLEGQTSIGTDEVRAFVYNYYKWSQLCADPSGQQEYVRLCEDCAEQKIFELLPMRAVLSK